MISDGRGMQADSIPINRTTPGYPSVEIVATIKPESISIIRATQVPPSLPSIEQNPISRYLTPHAGTKILTLLTTVAMVEVLQAVCPSIFRAANFGMVKA
jgi:hypothetical protein